MHLTMERGRRRASCGASRRFWRRAAARRHAHQHGLGNAAASERLSDQIALVGGARRSCARRRRLLAARRRARHSIASRPILLASFVLAFSLALAGRSAKSNGCSHGGPRLSQTRLARSVPAVRRSGAESTILRIGDADWRIGERDFSNLHLQNRFFRAARVRAARHDTSTSAGRRPSSACRLPLAPRSSVTFLVLVHRHVPHRHGRGGGLEPAATSSEHCAAGCCQSRRSDRPARGVQKSNRHYATAHEENVH